MDESLGLENEELELMENSALSQYIDAPGSRETSSHQDYEQEDEDDPLGAEGNEDGRAVQGEKEKVIITAATFAHGSDIREHSAAQREASMRKAEEKRQREEERWGTKGGRRGSRGR